jgi:hypothetical protein
MNYRKKTQQLPSSIKVTTYFRSMTCKLYNIRHKNRIKAPFTTCYKQQMLLIWLQQEIALTNNQIHIASITQLKEKILHHCAHQHATPSTDSLALSDDLKENRDSQSSRRPSTRPTESSKRAEQVWGPIRRCACAKMLSTKLVRARSRFTFASPVYLYIRREAQFVRRTACETVLCFIVLQKMDASHLAVLVVGSHSVHTPNLVCAIYELPALFGAIADVLAPPIWHSCQSNGRQFAQINSIWLASSLCSVCMVNKTLWSTKVYGPFKPWSVF